ncbi:restriction modification system DNA specificity domain-containing protein [Pectobacterium carotovorum subsp. carotovorum]|nr:restriction modification system DNA specificity domain-containing protein [Pectobacterium carotovorum subsp. carotovorum]GLX54944.1 restriction modification system DNA specificity domain-containing protein [Pectobacterium carotovorum subsp. carotovorum]
MTGRYKTYPEYKDSGVHWLREIPADWSVVPLKYLASLNPKKSGLDKQKMSEYCSFIPMDKLKLNNLRLDEAKLISDVYDGYTYFENEDVLLAKVTPCFENKNIAVAKNLLNGIGFGSSEIYVLRANSKLHNQFLFYRLQEDGFMEIATAAMSGAGGLKRVPAEVINSFVTAFPSLSEQQKIVNFLDHETAKIDTLIDKQEKLVELLKEKRQAVISHTVTKGLNPNAPMKDSGVEWVGEVPEHWGKITFKQIIKTRKGVAFSTSDFCDSGVRVVKASDIKQLTLKKSDVFLPEAFIQKYPKAYLAQGDIILSTVGSTPDVKNSAVGQVAMVPKELDKTLLNQNTVVFDPRCEKIDRNYLFFLLQTIAYRDHLDLNAHGTANQASLNVADMLDFKCSIPSIDEQKNIAEYLQQFLDTVSNLETKAVSVIELMKERKTALISAAVTGKIDVRDWEGGN